MRPLTFRKYVLQEIEGIKKHATQEERDKLDIEFFNPEYKNSCIYGLMTGNCNNERGIELIRLCTQYSYAVDNIGEVYVLLQVKPRSRFEELKVRYSLLELYIYKAQIETVERLMAYLKGESETFEYEVVEI